MTTDDIHDKIQQTGAGDCTLSILESINGTTMGLENQIRGIRQVLNQLQDQIDAHSKELKSLHGTVRSLCDIHP